MSRRLLGLPLVLFVAVLAQSSCGPRYLTEPPSEFDEYVESISVPAGSVLLGTYSTRWTSPEEICTGFGHDRLYGTSNAFTEVVGALDQSFDAGDRDYVKVVHDADSITYVLSDVSTLGVYHVGAADAATRLRHGAEVVAEGLEQYGTLFGLAAEHSYGKCVPHPWWPQ